MSWFMVGSMLAAVAVIAGAFGAHGLKETVSTEMLEVFETAVRYQMYHSLGLIAVGLFNSHHPAVAVEIAGWAFALGIVVFSGSLYAMVLSGTRWLGAVTPIGGLAFIAGWLLLAFAAWTDLG